MAYHRTPEEAKSAANFGSHGPDCFCRGCPLSGPIFTYDAHPDGGDAMASVHMHRDCAFIMAQRIILDVWRGRRDDHPMDLTAD